MKRLLAIALLLVLVLPARAQETQMFKRTKEYTLDVDCETVRDRLKDIEYRHFMEWLTDASLKWCDSVSSLWDTCNFFFETGDLRIHRDNKKLRIFNLMYAISVKTRPDGDCTSIQIILRSVIPGEFNYSGALGTQYAQWLPEYTGAYFTGPNHRAKARAMDMLQEYLEEYFETESDALYELIKFHPAPSEEILR